MPVDTLSFINSSDDFRRAHPEDLDCIYYTPIRGRTLPSISISEFRASLKIVKEEPASRGEEIYSYWNNQDIDSLGFSRDETLHIRKDPNDMFYLEIENIVHHGSLAELEVKLFEWARDEGWLD